MIDSIHLIFVEVLVGEPIERARAVEIGAERLLDDDTPPAARRRSGKTRRAELLDHRGVNR